MTSGRPISKGGAIHVSLTSPEPTSGVGAVAAANSRGLSGAHSGRAWTTWLHGPAPSDVLAATRNSATGTPRSLTVYSVAADTPSATVIQIIPSVDNWMM